MNTQITEDYVSFEVAKLLKEKGFDSDEVGDNGGFYSERCYESGHGVKTKSGQEVGIVYDDLTNSELDYDEYLRPTLQMAMKWLREVYNQNIILDMISLDEDCYVLWTFNVYCNKNYKIIWGTKQPKYDTYEEACGAAIKYCLTNLI